MKTLILTSAVVALVAADSSECNLSCAMKKCPFQSVFAKQHCMRVMCDCDLTGKDFGILYQKYVQKCLNVGSYSCETQFANQPF